MSRGSLAPEYQYDEASKEKKVGFSVSNLWIYLDVCNLCLCISSCQWPLVPAGPSLCYWERSVDKKEPCLSVKD